MHFSAEEKREIFDSNNGKCALCGKELVFNLHGNTEEEGGWEIDHSRAKADGGTEHRNNLQPMCWECNRKKSDMSMRDAKEKFGNS